MSKEDSSQFFRLYKHPQWQKRRLEVMQVSRFRCADCDSAEDTLNVHHISYVKGRKPWEYEDEELVCLCESCHQARHHVSDALKSELHEYRVRGGLSDDIRLIGYMAGVRGLEDPNHRFHFVDDFWSYVEGVCDGLRIPYLNSREQDDVFISLQEHFGCLPLPALIFALVDLPRGTGYYMRYGIEGFESYPNWLQVKIGDLFASQPPVLGGGV